MSGDGTRAGLDAAVDAAPEADEPEQLELLADLLGLPAPAEGSRAADIVEARRGRGRPAGARNRRTTAMAEWILAQTTPPVLTLARMASLPVDELAALLQCSVLEAWQEKRLCAQAAAPYLHQRMPIAVDVTTQTTVTLNIFEGEAPAQPGDDALVVEVVEFQQVSRSDDDAVGQ